MTANTKTWFAHPFTQLRPINSRTGPSRKMSSTKQSKTYKDLRGLFARMKSCQSKKNKAKDFKLLRMVQGVLSNRTRNKTRLFSLLAMRRAIYSRNRIGRYPCSQLASWNLEVMCLAVQLARSLLKTDNTRSLGATNFGERRATRKTSCLQPK